MGLLEVTIMLWWFYPFLSTTAPLNKMGPNQPSVTALRGCHIETHVSSKAPWSWIPATPRLLDRENTGELIEILWTSPGDTVHTWRTGSTGLFLGHSFCMFLLDLFQSCWGDLPIGIPLESPEVGQQVPAPVRPLNDAAALAAATCDRSRFPDNAPPATVLGHR